MPVADQPSILTVCLANQEAEMTRDIDDVLAARADALSAARRNHAIPDSANAAGCARGISEDVPRSVLAKGSSLDPTTHCPSCDDSAYGIDAIDCKGSSERDTAGRVECAGRATASFFHADSGKKALELLRVLRFDLLVTGDHLPDMSVSQLVRRVRTAWPWQKWALVGSQITVEDEITARTLGAMAVLDAPPDWQMLAEMADAICSRAASAAATAMANVGVSGTGGYAGAIGDGL